jgi:NAD(P)-dependent dehydrogenase (short-subunit alcohol dehydrogenase family)
VNLSRDLFGRVGLVTAASRKLGADIARQLADNGVHVAINYLESEAAARELCAELSPLGVRAIPLQADVSQPDQLFRLVEEATMALGPIDILVNNAGNFVETPFLQLPYADFDRIMSGNIRSTYLLTQMIGREMKRRGRGHVINIAATSAYDRSASVYSLAKAAVVNFTQAVALELAPEVRINAIAPDLIAENEDNPQDLVEKTIASTPLTRLVSRKEVAEMVCLLCSTAFDFVTGQTIIMDGGRTIRRAI